MINFMSVRDSLAWMRTCRGAHQDIRQAMQQRTILHLTPDDPMSATFHFETLKSIGPFHHQMSLSILQSVVPLHRLVSLTMPGHVAIPKLLGHCKQLQRVHLLTLRDHNVVSVLDTLLATKSPLQALVLDSHQYYLSSLAAKSVIAWLITYVHSTLQTLHLLAAADVHLPTLLRGPGWPRLVDVSLRISMFDPDYLVLLGQQCPRLTRITLFSSCRGLINDASIQSLVVQLPLLEQLIFEHLGPKSIPHCFALTHASLRAMQAWTRMRVCILHSTMMTTTPHAIDAASLAEIVALCPHWPDLEVFKWPVAAFITSNVLEALSNNCPNVQRFNLLTPTVSRDDAPSTAIDPQQWTRYLQTHRHVRHLPMPCAVPVDGCKAIHRWDRETFAALHDTAGLLEHIEVRTTCREDRIIAAISTCRGLRTGFIKAEHIDSSCHLLSAFASKRRLERLGLEVQRSTGLSDARLAACATPMLEGITIHVKGLFGHATQHVTMAGILHMLTACPRLFLWSMPTLVVEEADIDDLFAIGKVVLRAITADKECDVQLRFRRASPLPFHADDIYNLTHQTFSVSHRATIELTETEGEMAAFVFKCHVTSK
jgi:hypothetical protein